MYFLDQPNQWLGFEMISSSTGLPVPGATVTVQISIDGGAAFAGTGIVKDLGTGQYFYEFVAAETNGNNISVSFAASGCLTVEKTILPFSDGGLSLALVGAQGPQGPPGTPFAPTSSYTFTATQEFTVGSVSVILAGATYAIQTTGPVQLGVISASTWNGVAIGVAYGGLGLTTAPTTGQVPIGTSTGGYALSTLTAGSGIGIVNSSGHITINNTAVAFGSITNNFLAYFSAFSPTPTLADSSIQWDNTRTLVASPLAVTVAGDGVQVKEGSNCKQGTGILVAGTATVSNTSVTANSRIFVCRNILGATPGHWSITRVAGTSFTITSSSSSETSSFVYEIFEPA
jgi:hypothetical protein